MAGTATEADERARRARLRKMWGGLSITFFVAGPTAAFLFQLVGASQGGLNALTVGTCALLLLAAIICLLAFLALQPPFRSEML